jgi:hypothetical protein
LWCPKHVEQCLYNKAIKFYDCLLHLVGCFIQVIEDARNHKPYVQIFLCATSIFWCSKAHIYNEYEHTNYGIICITHCSNETCSYSRTKIPKEKTNKNMIFHHTDQSSCQKHTQKNHCQLEHL